MAPSVQLLPRKASRSLKKRPPARRLHPILKRTTSLHLTVSSQAKDGAIYRIAHDNYNNVEMQFVPRTIAVPVLLIAA